MMNSSGDKGKLKIAFMFYDGGTLIGGGPMVNGLRLLTELKKRGHEVLAMILAIRGESAAQGPLTEIGVECRVKAIPDYLQSLMRWTVKQVKAFQPDVFVPNLCIAGLFAAKWVKQAGIPTIATQRSVDERNRLIAKHFGMGNEWKTSGLVCVSRYLLDEDRKISGNDFDARVIPSGVPVPVHRANQDDDHLRIAYAGRIVHWEKNIFDVLDVFARLVNRFDNVECAFFGEGPEKSVLMDRVVSAGLQEKIRLHGFLMGDAYQEALSENHVIVLLSDYEGTPGAIMDGMACGLIPICKWYNGIDALVENGKTGFVVDGKNDVEAVVLQLLENKALRKEISENARRHIEKYYSIAHAAALWESFFYALIEKQESTPGEIQIPWRFGGHYPAELLRHETLFSFRHFITLKVLRYKLFLYMNRNKEQLFP